MLSAAGGCELATTTHVKTAWKKFKVLLPFLSSKTPGCVYSSCDRNAMLYAIESWPLTRQDLEHLRCNDRAMICLKGRGCGYCQSKQAVGST